MTPDYVEKLTLLDISKNQLSAIPLEVYLLVNLKRLFIEDCQIQSTKNALQNLVKLKSLSLANNNLEETSLKRLPVQNLEGLNISGNHFKALPSSIFSLQRLVVLFLNNNRLETLQGIGALVSLTELNVDDNMLTELPDEICLLVNIRLITMANNRIGKTAKSHSGQSIPADFLRNSDVGQLKLTGNTITKTELMGFDGMDEFFRKRKNSLEAFCLD